MAMDAIGSDRVVVVGTTGKIAWTSTASATTPTWTFKNLPSQVTMRSVKMIDADSWVVVGDEETVLRTDNAGSTWTGSQAALPPTASISAPTGGFPLTDSSRDYRRQLG